MIKYTSQLLKVPRDYFKSTYIVARNYSAVAGKKTILKDYFPVFSGFVVGFGFVYSRGLVDCDPKGTKLDAASDGNKKYTLYQYATCPFCNKVRTFLDFYGLDYDIVEVNPLFRNEIKFSEYRKVPILMSGEQQLNDSSLIISVLKTHLLGKGDIGNLLQYYPVLEDKEKRKTVVEYQNRYNIMYLEGLEKEQHQMVKEEAKWRRWVDTTFVHTLSPNIYRTMDESFRAMDYITNVGNFTNFERTLCYYSGAVAMYVIGKRVKWKYKLRNDVRESMYQEANFWMKAVGKKRKFLGGDQPNLADLNMYGVIRAIEGLDAFNDLMKNTNIEPWYRRVQKKVESKAGATEKDWLLNREISKP